MNKVKYFALAAIAAITFTAASTKAPAQVSIRIGAAPSCPYGYYDYKPYSCAPYGYYGTEWFHGGAFIGAGPWFHGPANFRGSVNNRLDVQHGYKGPAPQRGEKPEATKRPDRNNSFKGNEVRDGRGHAGK